MPCITEVNWFFLFTNRPGTESIHMKLRMSSDKFLRAYILFYRSEIKGEVSISNKRMFNCFRLELTGRAQTGEDAPAKENDPEGRVRKILQNLRM